MKGKCRKPARENLLRRKCNLRLKGSFRKKGKKGKNGFRYRGKLRGRKLKPGRYYLVATTRDAAGNRSKPRRAKFRISR